MSETEKENLVAAWLEFYAERDEDLNREARRAKHEKCFWAWERLNAAVDSEPELAWELILQIHRAEPSEWAVTNLAAGHLEDLLAKHGAEFIERVETQARQDSKFNNLLGGVWQNSMTDEIWRRVRAARREDW